MPGEGTGRHLGQTSRNTNHTTHPLPYFPILLLHLFNTFVERTDQRCHVETRLSSPSLHTRMSHNLQAHAHKLAPAPICTIFLGSVIISNCSQQDCSLLMRAELPQGAQAWSHDVALLTGGGGGGQTGVAGHGEPQHPVQLHLVPVHLLLLLLPLERPEPPDVGGAITGHLLPPQGAGGSVIRLHPGSCGGLDGGQRPRKCSLLSEEKRLSEDQSVVTLKSLTDSCSDLWWPSRPRPISVSLGVLCTKQRKSKDCTEDKIFYLKVNQ